MKAAERVLSALECLERHEEAWLVVERDLYPEPLLVAASAACGASCSVAQSDDPRRYRLRIAVAAERHPERGHLIGEILNTVLRQASYAEESQE
jgi:hypothetical protein